MQGRSAGYRTKKAVVRVALLALGVGFERVSKRAAELKAEIADWEEGRVFSLGVLPDGPAICLKKEGGRIRYLGQGHGDSTLKLLFKNLDCAFLPMTSQMGSETAYAQHRAILHGSVSQAMQLGRAMAMVQTYMLPGFVLKRTYKRPPTLSFGQRLFKTWIMATLGLTLLLNWSK